MNDAVERATSFAERKRAEIQAHAASLGIDREFVSELVDRFYGKIRADERLGPIFAREIDDWDPHLARMKAFWASVALNAGAYSGQPVQAHQKLEGVRRDDFDRWLRLFRETLEEIAREPLAVDYMMLRAERIAASLRMAMFDRPGAGAEAPPAFS